MESSGEDSICSGLEEKKLSNKIDSDLKQALGSAVGNSRYTQKTVLSAAIDSMIEAVDGTDDIYVVSEEMEEDLETWSDRYD